MTAGRMQRHMVYAAHTLLAAILPLVFSRFELVVPVGGIPCATKLPPGWCGDPGQTLTQQACDGDKWLDWACFDKAGNRGVLSSMNGCKDTWPSAPVSACPAAFDPAKIDPFICVDQAIGVQSKDGYQDIWRTNAFSWRKADSFRVGNSTTYVYMFDALPDQRSNAPLNHTPRYDIMSLYKLSIITSPECASKMRDPYLFALSGWTRRAELPTVKRVPSCGLVLTEILLENNDGIQPAGVGFSLPEECGTQVAFCGASSCKAGFYITDSTVVVLPFSSPQPSPRPKDLKLSSVRPERCSALKNYVLSPAYKWAEDSKFPPTVVNGGTRYCYKLSTSFVYAGRVPKQCVSADFKPKRTGTISVQRIGIVTSTGCKGRLMAPALDRSIPGFITSPVLLEEPSVKTYKPCGGLHMTWVKLAGVTLDMSVEVSLCFTISYGCDNQTFCGNKPCKLAYDMKCGF